MLALQIVRAALLGGGGLALGNAVALTYGGGHKPVTYAIWYLLGVLLLAVGVAFWIEIHRRKEIASSDSEQAGRTGIDNQGDMELEDASFGGKLDTSIKNRPGARFKGRGMDVY